MTNDLNNISPNSNTDKEKLLQQLNDDLFGDEDALDQQFDADADAGLQQINEHKIPEIVDKLNADLSRHLSKRKKRRGIFKDPSNFNITIITILILIIISFIVIKKLLG